MSEPVAIGNVADAARRYYTDAAAVWYWIASERVLVNPDGLKVRLIADPAKRYPPFKGAEATTWLIEEVVVGNEEVKSP